MFWAVSNIGAVSESFGIKEALPSVRVFWAANAWLQTNKHILQPWPGPGGAIVEALLPRQMRVWPGRAGIRFCFRWVAALTSTRSIDFDTCLSTHGKHTDYFVPGLHAAAEAVPGVFVDPSTEGPKREVLHHCETFRTVGESACHRPWEMDQFPTV